MLSGFDNRERRMNVGKTLFAQVRKRARTDMCVGDQ